MADENIRQKINQALGFDAGKEPSATADLFKEVIDEVKKNRDTQARDKARETVTKLVEICKQAAKLEREFKKSKEALDKEANKLYNQVQAALNGGTAPAAEPDAPETLAAPTETAT